MSSVVNCLIVCLYFRIFILLSFLNIVVMNPCDGTAPSRRMDKVLLN